MSQEQGLTGRTKQTVTEPASTVFPESTSENPIRIVGVGASAGGLKAFRDLLQTFPANTGMAMVFIQHREARRDSFLANVLSRATQMPVKEVTSNTPVEPNHVYVNSPNADITITKDILKPSPRPEMAGPQHPIDSFFRSLATEKRNNAIGVVLSGMGSDGTHGLQAIKAEGGVTFAQAEESAAYYDMPRSAIDAGCVDLMLNPVRIGQELARLAAHSGALTIEAASLEQSPPVLSDQSARTDSFHQIVQLLRHATRVDFTHYKPTAIRPHIRRRMALMHLDGLDAYANYLRDHDEEADNVYHDLFDAIRFFDDPQKFDLLKKKVFPEIVKRHSAGEPLRIWLPGCTTAEEAYSVAIAFREFEQSRREKIPVQMFATDPDVRMIQRASTGIYPPVIVNDVSPERLQRFFIKTENGFRISRSIRKTLTFACHDPVTDPPFARMDLIISRNPLKYLLPDLQTKVVQAFHSSSNPGGLLLFGSEKMPHSFTSLFHLVDQKHKIYSKTAEPITGSVRRKAGAVDSPMQQRAHKILLQKYAPASVLIDTRWKILEHYPATSAFLKNSLFKAGSSLLRVAPEGLVHPLRSVLQKAKKSGGPVRKDGVTVRLGRRSRSLNLEVIPISSRAAKELQFLVIFETAAAVSAAKRAKVTQLRAAGETDVQLQEELQSTRDRLQLFVEQSSAEAEELATANEELRSSNEALQNLNEELETTREQLEASNEALAYSNRDMFNLLSSIQIPIVMVDHDLRIRRFTPTARLLFNIVDADVGRPFTDLKLKVDLPRLPELLRQVMVTFRSTEQEVQARSGNWYSVQIRPYKTQEDKVEGAIVALVDIDQLKPDREKLRLLVELSFEPIIVWDFETGIIDWNQGCERLYGFTRAEAVGRHPFELLPTVHPAPVQEMIATLKAQGEWKGELSRTTRDGRQVIVESRRQIAEIGGRSVVLETNYDITDIRRANLNAQFIIQLDLAIAKMTEADEIVRLATRRLGEYMGVDRCHLSEINRKLDLSIVRQTWEGWLHGVPSLAGEYRIADFITPEVRAALEEGQAFIINDVGTDPRTRHLASSYAALGVGATIAVPALTEKTWEATLTVSQPQPRTWRPDEEQLLREITLRVWLAVKQSRSVEALRDSEARARRTLAEQMVAGVAECDASGKFKMVNQRFCDITGRTETELFELRVEDITHRDDWPHNADLYRRLFTTGEPFYIEKRYRRKDGSVIWVTTHVSPVRNAQGEIEESVAVVVDVTDRKRAEKDLQSAYERAEAATRAKDEFLSLVSHELRTPLVSILGYVQLLQVQTPDPALIRRVMEIVERNSKTQLQLIEDLLDTTRIMSGKLKLEVRPLDLADIIRAAFDVVRPAADAKGIQVHCALDPLATQITGDPERLQQTVLNLLSNAIKFTLKGGLVEVTLRRADPNVEIVVRDTGNGIAPEFLPHLFERFRQSDTSSTRRGGGLGLGLALVKHLVELHGGTVEAASAGVDRGTTFTVRLPVRAVYTAPPPAESAPTAQEQQRRTESLAGVHALVVDDEQEVRTLLTLTLESYGAKVQTASSGKEALQVLERQAPSEHFDVLICDIAMPDEDGCAVMRKVRTLPPDKGGDIPAVALTAYGRTPYRLRALEAGFQMHAVKPVNPDELVAMIQDLTSQPVV